MRTYLLILFAFFFQNIFSQNLPVDQDSKLITYSEVISTDGTADALYGKAYRWFSTYYKNPTQVIKESANHKIVARPRFKILNPPDKNGIQTMGGIVVYTFSVDFKDGRYKYTISEIEWKQNSKYPIERWMDTSSSSYKPMYAFYLEQVDKEITTIIDKFKVSVSQTDKKVEDNW